MRSMEDILVAIGGFGRFQICLCFGVLSAYMVIGWSLMQLSFSADIPEWYCGTNSSLFTASGSLASSESYNSLFAGSLNSDERHYSVGSAESSFGHLMESNAKCRIPSDVTTLKVCSINSTSCNKFCYEGSERTLINEFGLVCDLKWVKQLVTSIQMVGIFFGALLSGQLGDSCGRKRPFYGFLLLHAFAHIVAGWSSSWQMYTVCIFFIGFMAGGNLVVIFPYSLEFFTTRWRPVSSIIPTFQAGIAIFAGAAYLLKNWSHLHFACAVFTIPFLFGWFYFPESARWLAAHGRLEESKFVFERIARANGKTLPTETLSILENVAGSEKDAKATERKYSYADLFRSRKSVMITIFVCTMWIVLTASYYGISLGISSLGGNIYLNIFLMGVVEIPLNALTLYLNNKFGRKPTGIAFCLLATLSAAACIVVELKVPESEKDVVISSLCLTAKMMVSAAFCVVLVWGIELYPTVTRNLAFGLANVMGRVGGIAAPFAINLDDNPVMSYIVLTCLMAVCLLFSLLLPETKGRELADMLHQDIEVAGDDSGSIQRPLLSHQASGDYGSSASVITSDSQ